MENQKVHIVLGLHIDVMILQAFRIDVMVLDKFSRWFQPQQETSIIEFYKAVCTLYTVSDEKYFWQVIFLVRFIENVILRVKCKVPRSH